MVRYNMSKWSPQERHDYYIKHKEEISKKHREYYLKHREERIAKVFEYRKNNPEAVKERCRKYAIKNKDKIKEYKELRKERRNELARRDRRLNPEKYAALRSRRDKVKAKETRKLYAQTHKEKINNWKRLSHLKDKILAFYVYSDGTMKCSLCNSPNFSCLGLDHINGGGTHHRTTNPMANNNIYRLVMLQGFPEGYRLLCQNCNYLCHINTLSAKHGKTAKHRKKLKTEALSAYSDQIECLFCKEQNQSVLTLDHIDGGGRKELARLKIKGGTDYYRHLKRLGYPSGIRVLCFNCNCSRRIETPSDELISSVIQKFLLHQKSSYIESVQK
jgi:hypothetical protein